MGEFVPFETPLSKEKFKF